MRIFSLHWTTLVGLLAASVSIGCSPETFPGDKRAGTGGTGGTGGATPCTTLEDCPEGENPCTERACINGQWCGEQNDDNLVPPGGTQCTTYSCKAGEPVITFEPTTKGCGADPTQIFCDGVGNCVCADDGDCPADTPCRRWDCNEKKCVPMNGVTDQFLDPEGDCTKRSCSDQGALIEVADLDDVKADEPNECTKEVCLGIGAPAYTVQLGLDCGGVAGEPTCDSNSGFSKGQDKCNARGGCDPGEPIPCGSFLCGETQCKTMCLSESADCAAGHYCDQNSDCVKKKEQGAECAKPNECSNQLPCADGRCCNNTCTTLCFSCDLGSNLGTCTALPKGVADGCSPGTACVNNGTCASLGPDNNKKKAVGQPCVSEMDCFNDVAGSLQCVFGLCRLNIGTDCSSLQAQWYCEHNLCENGKCQPCGADSPCPDGGACSAVGRCLLPNLSTCGATADCMSGYCNSNVCAPCIENDDCMGNTCTNGVCQ